MQQRRGETYPTVSPHVGLVPSSHMKLPMNAQIEDTNNVAGMKTEVAKMTGLANILSRKMCAYDTSAAMNVSIVRSGIVCSNVVYGILVPFGSLSRGSRVVNKMTKDPTMQTQTQANHAAVHIESL